jgi:uncharacterized membrane protein YcaP (DUF421 family)
MSAAATLTFIHRLLSVTYTFVYPNQNMFKESFQLNFLEFTTVVLSGVLIYIILIVFSRLVGPRSFARMTAFDLAVTVALGAIVGATSTGGVPILQGLTGLSTLFFLRWLVAIYRRHNLGKIVDNSPLMLMDGPEILPEYLKRAKITEADLLQSLRQHGIRRLEEVQAVVMERDGSISVLKADVQLEVYLLKGVKGHPATGEVHIEPTRGKNQGKL